MRTLGFVFLAACGGGPAGGEAGKPHEGSKKPDPVTVVEAVACQKGSVAEVLTSSAVVESEASADLVPETTGVVREIRKDEGDPVEKGDVLAILDNVSLGTGAARASAEVARLEQQIEEARGLLSQGAISMREVEDLEHQLSTARLSSQEASSSYGSTRLTAPFAGVVAMRDVHVGELATSAKPAFQVVDPDRLRVVASLPERDIGRVSLEQPVRLVSAYDEEVWTTGAVARLSPVVDAASGTFRATVSVSEPGRLRPGQFVSVQIEVDRHQDVLVVPKRALLYQDGVPVVFRVTDPPAEEEDEDGEGTDDEGTDGEDKAEASGGGGWWPFGGGDEGDEGTDEDEAPDAPAHVATRTPVELGLVDDSWAEILGGLSLGDEVITVGHSHLRDGGRVRLASEPGSASLEEKPGSEGDEG